MFSIGVAANLEYEKAESNGQGKERDGSRVEWT